jgi:hypothetical protein
MNNTEEINARIITKAGLNIENLKEISPIADKLNKKIEIMSNKSKGLLISLRKFDR